MLIDFNASKEMTGPGMNNGSGIISARMHIGDKGILPRKEDKSEQESID